MSSLLTSLDGVVIAGGVVLTGARWISIPAFRNAASGNVDSPACPADKRWAWSGRTYRNPTAGDISVFPQLKIGSDYFKIGPTFTAIHGAGLGDSNSQYPCIVLEPGEVASFNTSAAGLVIYTEILEFDIACPLWTAKVTNFVAGDNPLATIVGSAKILDEGFLSPGSIGLNAMNPGLFYFNDSGASRTINWNIVDSGDSPSGTNSPINQLSVPNGTYANKPGMATLGAGDSISINVDANTAKQIAWVNLNGR